MMIRALLHIAFYSGKQHTTGDGLMPMVNLARYVLYRIQLIIITLDVLKIIFISDSTQFIDMYLNLSIKFTSDIYPYMMISQLKIFSAHAKSLCCKAQLEVVFDRRMKHSRITFLIFEVSPYDYNQCS